MPLFFDRLFPPADHDGVKSEEKSGERRGQGPEDKKGIQNADSTGLFVTTCDSSILFGNINGTECQLFVTDCNIDEDVVTAHQAVLDHPLVLYAASHGHLPGLVMWKSIPSEQTNGWQRQWFGNELAPAAVFKVRGFRILDRQSETAESSLELLNRE